MGQVLRKLAGIGSNWPGEAKVENLNNALLRCDEVLRFEVAMDETLGVGGKQATCYLCPQARERGRFRMPAHQRPTTTALDQFHREEPATFEFPELKPGNNVRMLQSAHHVR